MLVLCLLLSGWTASTRPTWRSGWSRAIAPPSLSSSPSTTRWRWNRPWCWRRAAAPAGCPRSWQPCPCSEYPSPNPGRPSDRYIQDIYSRETVVTKWNVYTGILGILNKCLQKHLTGNLNVVENRTLHVVLSWTVDAAVGNIVCQKHKVNLKRLCHYRACWLNWSPVHFNTTFICIQ